MVDTRSLLIIFIMVVNVKSNLVQKTLYIDTTGGKYFQVIPIGWFVNSRRIHIRVQALEDAQLALLKEGDHINPLFEVIFGADKNNKCYIKKYNKIVAFADTPGVLDPGSYKGFWISWHTNSNYLDFKTVFVVRVGHEGDDSAFLTTWDINPGSLTNAYYIGVRSNPKKGTGFWEIDVTYNETNITSSNKEVVTDSVPKKEPDYDSFYPIAYQRIEFKVKIKQDAWICLSKYRQKLDDTYQIILGGWGNTKCVIMKDDYTSKIVEQECNGATNSEYYRGFWISLENVDSTLIISVGNDGEILPFIKFVDFVGTRLKYYSVACTGKDNKAYWILKVTQPTLLKYIKTEQTKPVIYSSFDPIPKSGSILIKTKATRDAWVGLTSSYSNDPEFEIIIGGWNNIKSTIRRHGKDVVEFNHNKLLDTGTHYTGFRITVRQEELMFEGVVQKLYLVMEVNQEDEEKPFLRHKLELDMSNPMQLNYYSVGSTLDTEWIVEASVRRIDNVIPKYYISYDNPSKYHLYTIENERVEFEIKTAKNAIISLTTSSYTPKIEISLLNEVTKIYKDGNIKETFNTYFNMSNEVYQGFWIDWKYNTKPKSEMCLRFGHQGEASILFEWRDPEPFLIKYIGVDTRNYIGYWKFYDAWLEPKYDKLMPHLITHDNPKNYQFFPIIRNPIRFKVKASRDANLAFTTNAVRSKPILEVLLGAFGKDWESQYTYIRKDFQQDSPAEIYTKTPNILSNNDFVGFWVNWEYIEDYSFGLEPKMKMEVGLEGEDALLTWEGKDIFPINYVGVTGYRSTAVWLFEDDVEIIHKKKWKEVTTFDKDRYKFFPILVKPLRLQVKTSKNAYIALATAPTEGTFPFLECKIGTENNTKTIMLLNRDKQLAKYEGDTIGIIRDSFYESFWLDWNNFTNEAGKAKMAVYLGRKADHNYFASLIIDPFDIHFFGITTEGDTAFWHFEEIAESLPPFITTYNHTKDYQFYIAPKQALKFYVKAASDAYIALSATNSSSDVMYEIMLGVESNHKSYIRKNKEIPKDVGNWTEVQLPSAQTENILSSSSIRGFWIEWIYRNPPSFTKRVLRISVGHQGQVQPFLRWHDSDPLAIKFIGFTGGNDNTLWKFEDVTEDILPDNNINVVTIEPRAYDFAPKNYTQVTTSNFTYQFFSLPAQNMSFKVKTQSEIYIVLTSRPQLYNLFPMYEILIGGRNKITWIKRANGIAKTIVNTPLVLNVSQFRGFWVSWFEGNIEVGFIDKLEPFMSWTDPDPINVNFIGITSRYSAVWQITDTTIKTNDDTYHIFPIAADKTMFLLKAPEKVRLKLITKKEKLDPIVEIILGSKENTAITFQREGLFYSKDVGGVLEKNNFRGFWLSWALGQFTVGLKGESHPLAFFDDPQPSSPNYIGFSGKNGTTVTWQFKVAPVWKPLQWNSNNDNPCFLDPNGRECKDRNLLLQLHKNRPKDTVKRLVNDCDNARWKNAFQCNKLH